jgi:putative ABC transport system ATP-binding protein
MSALIAAESTEIIGCAAVVTGDHKAGNRLQGTLETRNLSRAVGDKILLSDVSVRVERGEVLAVVGPSGAGKSSFLRLLNRLDEPTNGTVLLNGRDYRTLAPQELRRRVGMVMQRQHLVSLQISSSFGCQVGDVHLCG